MILDREELQKALATCKLSVGHKYGDVANYVKFVVDPDDGSVAIATTDYSSLVMCGLEPLKLSEEELPETFLLEYKRLHTLVNASTSGGVLFKQVGKGKIEVTTNGSYTFRCHSKPNDFPFVNLDFQHEGTMSPKLFKSILGRASFVLNKNAETPEFKGIYYDGSWTATNGRSQSSVVSEVEASPFFVPSEVADVLSKCKGPVDFGRNDDGGWLVMSCDENMIVAAYRLMDVSFPDYKKVNDSFVSDVGFTINKDTLAGILKRAQCFTEKDGDSISVEVTDTHAIWSVSGKTSEKIEIGNPEFRENHSAGYVKSSFSIAPIAAALKNLDDQNVKMSISVSGFLWIHETVFDDEGNPAYVHKFLTTNVIG
jgi:DNA polymerase III sliding clamp (beta) subunit (PCNA family)